MQTCDARPAPRLRAGQAGKMLVPLLSVVALLAIGVAAVAIVLKFKEQEKRIAKEQELQQAQSHIEVLQRQVNDIQQAKAKIEEELSRARKELVQSAEELKQAVAKQTELTKSLDDREKEIGRITKDLEQTRNEAKTVAAKLSQLQTERDGLKQQIAALEKTKSDLQAAGGESEPTVELGKVKVTNEGTATPSVSAAGSRPTAPSSASSGAAAKGKPASSATATASTSSSSDGQVVVVNREYDFIVMNLGKNQGLSVGQEFQVVRNNEVLGKVKVEKVYDELSAAAILPESKKDSIREGDLVRAL